MFRTFIITLAGAGLLGGAVAAAPTVGAVLGTDRVGIAAALSPDRYEISRFERVPDAISVTALSEHRRLELALDSATGAVIGVAEYDRAGDPERPAPDDAALKAMLADQGWAVTDFRRESDEIEVRATRDGRSWELELDPRSGRIREIESEEEDG
jgi:hypothetical protein